MRSIIDTITGDAPPEVDADLDIDTALDILRNERRRHVIDELAGRERADANELADVVARHEYDDPTGQERKRVYVGLYQSHLPTMVEADVLNEVRRNEFEPGPAFESVNRVLEAVREVTA